MRSRMQKSPALEIIRVHKSEIKNIVFKDNGKEIYFNGEMYDVKKKIVEGDYLVFKCVNDKKENQLIANLENHVQNNISAAPSSGHKQNDISKNIVKDFFFTGIAIPLPVFSFFFIHPSSFFIYNSSFSSVPFPPPEVFNS